MAEKPAQVDPDKLSFKEKLALHKKNLEEQSSASSPAKPPRLPSSAREGYRRPTTPELGVTRSSEQATSSTSSQANGRQFNFYSNVILISADRMFCIRITKSLTFVSEFNVDIPDIPEPQLSTAQLSAEERRLERILSRPAKVQRAVLVTMTPSTCILAHGEYVYMYITRSEQNTRSTCATCIVFYSTKCLLLSSCRQKRKRSQLSQNRMGRNQLVIVLRPLPSTFHPTLTMSAHQIQSLPTPTTITAGSQMKPRNVGCLLLWSISYPTCLSQYRHPQTQRLFTPSKKQLIGNVGRHGGTKRRTN